MALHVSLVLSAAAAMMCLSSASATFVCPENLPCYCMRSEEDDRHKVHCTTNESEGSAFDLTVHDGKSLRVQCVNSPDWTDFLLGASIRVGNVTNFHYVGCELPGPRHSDAVVAQLGLVGVEFLKVDKLRGNVSKQDLDVFPDLKRLVLTGNSIGNVTTDLLYGLPQLTQLDLRGTQVELPGVDFFQRSRSLVSLELSQNNLRDLRPGAFDGLDSIELLNMWSSNITSLHPQTFRGLSTLSSLDIKMNRLRELPVDVFRDLTNLKIINFGINDFTELPAELFARNRHLKVVKLTHNRANISRLPDNFLGDLRELKAVSLERAGLQRVPENLLWGSDAIVELNMNRNYLTTLPANLLRDARQLHKLSLSFNDLRALPDGLFASLAKLVSLDLSKNHLGVVSENLFDGLDALQELNMEENDLKYIEVDALVSLGALQVAKFSRNQLSLRTDMFDLFGQLSPFYGCKSLEELYLAHNNITEIYGDWTIGLTKLRKLDLSYNSLEYLQTEDLQFVSSKLQVDLTHNAISTIDLSRLESIASEQNDSPRQVVVNMNFNPIYCDCQLYSLLSYTNGELRAEALDFVTLQVQHLTCDGPRYMQGARLLSLKARELKCALDDGDRQTNTLDDNDGDNDDDRQSTDDTPSTDPCAPNGLCSCWLRPVDRTLILDCAGRNLSEAPATITVGNSNYVEIDLSGNSLTVAPNMTANGYEIVRSLNLADNQIEHVNDSSLISSNLQILRLNGNKLSFIDDEILEKIASNSNVSLLTLHDNPWRCDCESLALLDFVHNSYQLLSERHNISCAATNLTLSTLQPADLCPYPVRSIVVACLSVACLALVASATVALFFYYQRQIKVYLYSKNLCLWLITQEEIDKDKVWDAFVSYSHQDEQFVVEELASQLENGARPYKLCLHGRDWLPGDWIPNNIMRSVEGSRRTIIVLSSHYVDSEWAKLEFQAAYKKALSDKCARLIIILYGDIDPATIADPDLRGYLQMNTYVKWGDPWFYQKLRYALPHKHALTTEDVKSNKSKNLHVAGHDDIVQVKVCR